VNAVLDQRVTWTVYSDHIALTLRNQQLSIPHSAIIVRWDFPGMWWEDGLDRRYYRVEVDGRIGDFYENDHGQFLERWRRVSA
jgi:hypothetical protein